MLIIKGIVEGRGPNNGQIGMAAIDLNRPGIEVSQFTDTSGYSSTLMKMLVWMPIDVLLPHSALDQSSNMNRFVKLLEQSEFGCNIIGVSRHSFNNQQGLEYLKGLCHPHYLPSIYAFQEKYYGLSAVAGLFNYLETAKHIYYAPKSLKVEFGCSSQATMLDATSALRLGLVGSLGRSSNRQTLFKSINYTCTLSGARRLRASLLEPPNDLTTITCRQESVAELISKPQILLDIQNVLAKFPAIDSLLSMCVQLSEFPVPRTDLIRTASFSTSSAGVLRHGQTTSSANVGAVEDLLTPSSDLRNDRQSAELRPTTVSGLNICPTSTPAPTTASMKEASVGKGSVAASSLVSGVTIEKNAELRITKLIAIKHMLSLIRPLYDALEGTYSTLLGTYREILSNVGYTELLEKMTTMLHHDACVCKGSLQMRVQKCFAIKPGINVLLDLTRRAYAEQVDDISHYVKGLASQYNLPLRVGYNKARGFFIQIPEQALHLRQRRPQIKSLGGVSNSNLPSSSQKSIESSGSQLADTSVDSQVSQRNNGIPEVFIKVQISRGLINCTTDQLVKLNGKAPHSISLHHSSLERVKGSLNEVYLIADNLACKLVHDLHPEMRLFYLLSEAVSGLDLLCSLARIVVSAPPGCSFVKPIFGDTLAIQEGRHMILDRFGGSRPVSNNTFASVSQNVAIILGTCMSGKTTYLTQVALMQILAQIGSFVPAKFAAFRLTDKIFARMGCRDDMYTHASAFALEMREVGHVFRSATDNSLILIDDLGLSTTDEDCFSLSYAICDALAKKRAFTFFTSSDPGLSRLQSVHLNVEIYHFQVETRGVAGEGRRVALPTSPINESFSSVATSSFYEPSEVPERRGKTATRTLYRYTYRLKKGVGEATHSGEAKQPYVNLSQPLNFERALLERRDESCERFSRPLESRASPRFGVIEQIGLTALDPLLVEMTRKYYNILMHGKAPETDDISLTFNTSAAVETPHSSADSSPVTARKRPKIVNSVTPRESGEAVDQRTDRITPGASVNALESPAKQGSSRDSVDNEMTDRSESDGDSFARKNPKINEATENVPAVTEINKCTSPIQANEVPDRSDESKNSESHPNEEVRTSDPTEESDNCAETKAEKVSAGRGVLSSADRLSHRLVQQVQMLACVVRCVDRVTASAPTAARVEEKAFTARQSALHHLAFLRERYAGALRNLEEE